MKGLAKFVMRGRLQALVVAVAGAGSLLFCWISAAAIALVTLRRGAGQGAWLLLWAVLPAGALMLAFGDSGPLALLLGTGTLALVLRLTVSLPLALLASVPVGLVTGWAVAAFGGPVLEQMLVFFDQFLGNLEQQMAAEGAAAVELARPTALQVAGMLGAANAVFSVLCLLLARWWQAALYNPGGFGSEFRALYYPPAVSTLLLVAALGLASLGLEYRSWASICVVPLTAAGLALLHARVALRGRGSGLLAGFYVAWVLFDLVKIMVVIAAVADSWLGFRQRWPASAGTDVSRRDDSEDRD
ncbi:hypothetical protein Q6D67_17620 [Haliea sp. E1-2-M8]|uniref:hypothetical protein n=1 Tax=Haliea sp. E1-2-M8 TaxID=3064706 RepID=UPI00271A87A0|nr:hypothetical protein [Haliea sp. E1-2-M8]MDO8863522.1 hypothetical protein [Haliea sp. E1-2-M8]